VGAVILALIALGVIGYEKTKPKPVTPPANVPVAPSLSGTAAGAIGGADAGGTTTTAAPKPPVSMPAPATGPGLYPAGTPGALPILVQTVGGDGDCWITAEPGGVVGPSRASSKTFWYGPGTSVVFSARVAAPDGFPTPFTAFDHFEGPGVSTRSNPIEVPTITTAGFVRGVFSFLGRVGA
jgi:hypothetical protein